CQQSGGFTF
nr:immunoglobulin light chain junction region [Homo sapiens]